MSLKYSPQLQRRLQQTGSLGMVFGIFLMAMLIGTRTSAQKATLQNKIDANEIVVGDQVRMFVEVQLNPKVETVQWSQMADTFNTLEIVERSKIDTVKGNYLITYKQTLLITGFDSGAFTIPAMAFTIKPAAGSPYLLYTDSFTLHVQTLDADTSKPFKAIKGIVPVATSWTDYLPMIAGLLAVVALVVFVIYFFRKNKALKTHRKAMRKEHFWDRSMRMLDELEREKLWEQGDVKAYYTRLTDILREYLERRFSIMAKEKTTEEINAIARKIPELRTYRKQLRDVLLTADMAKFAKAQPLPEEHLNALNEVRTFIATTKPPQEEGAKKEVGGIK